MRRDQLAGLRSVAELLSQQKLAEVARHTQICADMEHRIAQIEAHRQKLMGPSEDPVHSAILAGQARRLRQQQIAAITQLAGARAKLELAKTEARPAFGRKTVLSEILKDGVQTR